MFTKIFVSVCVCTRMRERESEDLKIFYLFVCELFSRFRVKASVRRQQARVNNIIMTQSAAAHFHLSQPFGKPDLCATFSTCCFACEQNTLSRLPSSFGICNAHNLFTQTLCSYDHIYERKEFQYLFNVLIFYYARTQLHANASAHALAHTHTHRFIRGLNQTLKGSAKSDIKSLGRC